MSRDSDGGDGRPGDPPGAGGPAARGEPGSRPEWARRLGESRTALCLDRPEEAGELALQGLEAAQRAGSAAGAAEAILALVEARAAAEPGFLAEASLLAASRVPAGSGDPAVAPLLARLATLLFTRRDLDAARAARDRLREGTGSAADLLLRLEAAEAMGQGRLADAASALGRAALAARDAGDRRSEVEIALETAELAVFEGRPDRALGILAEAERWARQAGLGHLERRARELRSGRPDDTAFLRFMHGSGEEVGPPPTLGGVLRSLLVLATARFAPSWVETLFRTVPAPDQTWEQPLARLAEGDLPGARQASLSLLEKGTRTGAMFPPVSARLLHADVCLMDGRFEEALLVLRQAEEATSRVWMFGLAGQVHLKCARLALLVGRFADCARHLATARSGLPLPAGPGGGLLGLGASDGPVVHDPELFELEIRLAIREGRLEEARRILGEAEAAFETGSPGRRLLLPIELKLLVISGRPREALERLASAPDPGPGPGADPFLASLKLAALLADPETPLPEVAREADRLEPLLGHGHDPYPVGYLAEALGRVRLAEARGDEAERLLGVAREKMVRTRSVVGETLVLAGLAGTALAAGRRERARGLLAEARDLEGEVRDAEGSLELDLREADLAAAWGDGDEAGRLREAALARAREAGFFLATFRR